MIANLKINKDAISGIINVVALGTSFLCGAFVPMDYLPDFVLKIAHLLPSYWYIKTNELLKNMQLFNFENLKPVLLNMVILIIFSLIFIKITNYLTNKNQVN